MSFSANSRSVSWAGEMLNDRNTSAGQPMASRQARRNSRSDSSPMRPVSSASAMKSDGGTKLPSARCQRASASKPMMRRVVRSIIG